MSAHTSLGVHTSAYISLGTQKSENTSAHTSLGAHTSAHMSAHTSLGAHTSAHMSLGAHTSACMGHIRAPEYALFLPREPISFLEISVISEPFKFEFHKLLGKYVFFTPFLSL